MRKGRRAVCVGYRRFYLGHSWEASCSAGVGAGTALVEYSSFTYAGEKKIGWEDLETKNLDFSFDRQKGSLIVDTGFWGRRVSDGIEADPAVPEGIIRYEVTYNKKRVGAVPGVL